MTTAKKKSAPVAVSDSPYSEENYRAESDMRTLMDAHKIKNDPKRHTAAKLKAREQMVAHRAIVAGKVKGEAK